MGHDDNIPSPDQSTATPAAVERDGDATSTGSGAVGGGAPTDSAVDAEAMARLLSALSHPIRVRILERLLCSKPGDCCVTDFVEELGAEQPKVSQHLKLLRDAGLIACRTNGRKRCYSVIRPTFVRTVLEASALEVARAKAVRRGEAPPGAAPCEDS